MTMTFTWLQEISVPWFCFSRFAFVGVISITGNGYTFTHKPGEILYNKHYCVLYT